MECYIDRHDLVWKSFCQFIQINQNFLQGLAVECYIGSGDDVGKTDTCIGNCCSKAVYSGEAKSFLINLCRRKQGTGAVRYNVYP